MSRGKPFPEDENGNAIGAPGAPTKKVGDSDYLEHPEQWTTGMRIQLSYPQIVN